ncbi:MAG: NADH-dependent butanol dehydrogenase B [Candidatus Izimaplasma bacterium HR2]|nr:MAG: NADH-dependent butanol dehydrogenase B [Candidatus Izimaplasma bacterium HR2]
MKNFEYRSLTKIIFGKDQISNLERELEEFKVRKLLLVYGMSSIKNLGIYEQVIFICNKLDIEVYEEGGVRPNPDMSSVRSGIETCRTNDIDFVLAAGGGSAIDCAKAIAFGTKYDGDPWDVYLLKDKATSALPLGVIITLAATGTETNGNSVISNDETGEKRSVAYPFSVPKFAIIDPSYTLSVDRYHVIAGSMDIMMHVFEQFFSNTLRTETSDYMSMGVIKSVIENTSRYLAGEDGYETRANLSWASTIGLNWILGVDKVGDWATHRLSYPITKEYGITHGYALALIFTSWIRVALKYNSITMIPRLEIIGDMIFDGTDYSLVPDKLDELFSEWGAKVKLSEELKDVTLEEIDKLIENALALGSVGTVIEIDKEKALEIFKNSLGW